MSERSKRRHARYPIRLPVTLVRGARTMQLFSRDVSHGGLFLHTDHPPPLRELVRLRMKLPPDRGDEEAELLGMAVHRVEAGGHRSPGVGVNLYGNGPAATKKWSAFIRWLAINEGVQLPEPAMTSDDMPQPVPELRVRVKRVADLEKIRDRDLKAGRLFVRTNLWLERDTKVTVDLVHPETGRVFKLPGRVKTQLKRDNLEGLGIELVADPDRDAEFSDFIDDTIYVTVDMGCELIDEAI